MKETNRKDFTMLSLDVPEITSLNRFLSYQSTSQLHQPSMRHSLLFSCFFILLLLSLKTYMHLLIKHHVNLFSVENSAARSDLELLFLCVYARYLLILLYSTFCYKDISKFRTVLVNFNDNPEDMRVKIENFYYCCL